MQHERGQCAVLWCYIYYILANFELSTTNSNEIFICRWSEVKWENRNFAKSTPINANHILLKHFIKNSTLIYLDKVYLFSV